MEFKGFMMSVLHKLLYLFMESLVVEDIQLFNYFIKESFIEILCNCSIRSFHPSLF